MDRLDGIADHRQRAIAQEIDLHQAGVFGTIFFELDDRNREIGIALEGLGRPLHRHIVGERGRSDHDSAGMYRQVPGDPDQTHGHAGKLLPGIGQIEALKVGVSRYQVGELPLAILEEGNPPGDLPDLTRRPAVHLGHLAQGAAGLKAVVIGHHGGMKPGILAEDVLQHLVALIPGEVEIDVGRIAALQVEKALEHELGAEWDRRG